MGIRSEQADEHPSGGRARLALFTLVTLGCVATAAPGAAHLTTPSRVDVAGTITTDTEWTAGHVYVISLCDLTIAAGATLTVRAV